MLEIDEMHSNAADAALKKAGIPIRDMRIQYSTSAGMPPDYYILRELNGQESFLLCMNGLYDDFEISRRRALAFHLAQSGKKTIKIYSMVHDEILISSEFHFTDLNGAGSGISYNMSVRRVRNRELRNAAVKKIISELKHSSCLKKYFCDLPENEERYKIYILLIIKVIFKILFQEKQDQSLGKPAVRRFIDRLQNNDKPVMEIMAGELSEFSRNDIESSLRLINLGAEELFLREDSLFGILSRYSFYSNEDSWNEKFSGITPTTLSYIYGMLLPQNIKKKTGVFYTHFVMSDHIAALAFNTYLQSGDKNNYEKISSLKIADPGCGCGAFIISIIHFVKSHLISGDAQHGDLNETLRRVISNIHCWDIDADALEIAQRRVFLMTGSDIRLNAHLQSFIDEDNNLAFDIIVGNPPYVGHKGGSRDLMRSIKDGGLGKFSNERMDLYYYFFHKGMDLLNQNGILAFITTKYFLRADSAVKLREDIHARMMVRYLIDFQGTTLFDDAPNHNSVITVLEKTKDVKKAVALFANDKTSDDDFHNIFSMNSKYSNMVTVPQDSLFKGDLKRIIATDNSRYGKIFERFLDYEKLKHVALISQGIVTGADKVTEKHTALSGEFVKGDGIFVMSEKTIRGEFGEVFDTRLLKPWYKSSDIERYYCSGETDYFLLLSDPVFESDNSIYKQHIIRYEKILKARNTDSGELTKAFREGRWWSFSSSRRTTCFSSPKIVAPQRGKRNTFAYSGGEWYASADVYFIFPGNEEYPLSYLLLYLNSKVVYLYLKSFGKIKGDLLELYQQPLSDIPVLRPDDELRRLSEKYFRELSDADKESRNTAGEKVFLEFEELLCKKMDLDEQSVSALNEFYESR